MPNQLIDREAASDTPRTDAAVGRTADCRWSNKAMGEAYEAVENLARTLERELAAAQAEIAALREDAERFEFLYERCLAIDTEWGNRKETVLVFRWPADVRVGANLRAAIDLARKPKS